MALGEECSRQREQKVQRSWARNTLDVVEEWQEANLAGTELGRECLVGDEVRELCPGTDHVGLCRPL